MLTKEEVLSLLGNIESDIIERTVSVREDKLGPAVCAFSNDLPNRKLPGYIFIGVKDDGTLAGMKIGDKLLQEIGNIRSNGNVLPQPSLTVSPVYEFKDGDVVVIEVHPSFHPPVRFNGKCYIRIGPRKALANDTDERRLIEKRTSTARTLDARPFPDTTINDLNIELFKLSYLPAAIDRETLAANNRTIKQQLSSLRLFDSTYDCPTHAGILLLGVNPQFFLFGSYINGS